MPRPWAWLRPVSLLALTSAGAGMSASEATPIGLRFAGLERLYFERLDDPAAATSGLRRGGRTSPLAEDLRTLLPAAFGAKDGASVEGRVVEPSIGPIGFGTVTRCREVDEPRFIERGGGSVVEARTSKSPPEAPLDPPSDAVELCRGHFSGARLPNGRPGLHISWTLYAGTETRPASVKRYQDALGDQGHSADSDCNRWRAHRPKQIDGGLRADGRRTVERLSAATREGQEPHVSFRRWREPTGRAREQRGGRDIIASARRNEGPQTIFSRIRWD